MAKSFSTKQYFKKIYSPDLLTELYKRHSISAFFEITPQSSRKNVVTIFNDFYNALDVEQKYDINQELMVIESISTPHATLLFESLLKEKKLGNETTIECFSDYDRVLYYYLFHKAIFDDVLFFHAFYVKPNYMLYEAKQVDMVKAELAITELSREFTRLANKEDRVTECLTEGRTLNNMLYVNATFEGASVITPKKDAVTGDIEKQRTAKKIEEVRIVYMPQEKEVLISYTGSKYEKLIFLDTFLRIVCDFLYTEKVESFNLSLCKNESFDFSKTNKGIPLLTWKIRSVTLSFGNTDDMKKRMKLTLPSTQQEYGLAPLFSTLQELGIEKNIASYTIENIALSFSFSDRKKSDTSVNISATISSNRSSLCPLFFYHTYARTLLKNSGVRVGFVEVKKKEKKEGYQKLD